MKWCVIALMGVAAVGIHVETGLISEYMQANEVLTTVSVPADVVDGDEHAAVADRQDVDFAFDDFVNDAIGVSGKRRAT